MIEFDHVTQRYDTTVALRDLNLSVESGELFVLVGPSGSGKTTLLKMVNRLNTPTSGRILIDGVDVAERDLLELRQHIGYVLQSGALFPNMSVEQNAGIELEVLGWKPEARRRRVRDLLSRVGLEPEKFCDRMPSELSGGEAQRVGIVRALAAKPQLMLMDEPFSALDPVSRRQLQELVLRLHEELGITVIFVTHDMREAVLMADRLAVMHQGVLQQCGKPEDIIEHPANDIVRSFFDEGMEERHTVRDVMEAGFGTAIAASNIGRAPSGVPVAELPASASVFDWAAELRRDPSVKIKVGGTLLNPDDLVKYLASRASDPAAPSLSPSPSPSSSRDAAAQAGGAQ